MLNEHEIRIETLARILREKIAEAQKGYLPVDIDASQNWIDFAVAHMNASFNDGYVSGLKSALASVEGVFQIETSEAQSA